MSGPPADAADPLDDRRFDVPSAARLVALVHAPLAMRAGPAVRQLHRDLYLDSADDALRSRGVVCRLRVVADDRQLLTLDFAGPRDGRAPNRAPERARRIESRVHTGDPRAAVAEHTAVGRRLQALVNSSALEVRAELEVERWTRRVGGGWLLAPRLELHYDLITARRGALARAFQHLSLHRRRGRPDELQRLARAFEQEHGLRPIAAAPRERAELLLKWGVPGAASAAAPTTARVPNEAASPAATAANGAAPAAFLNPELSLLAFQERVLALAEDPETPLRERLRFVAIVTANLDEFYMVRVAGLSAGAREQMEEQGEDGLTPAARREAVAGRAALLAARQARCFHGCVAELAKRGTRICNWAELGGAERAALGAYFRGAVLPALTPLAMTLSSGHPLPHFPHLSLSLAMVLRGPGDVPPRFVELELPAGVPRFVPVPGTPAEAGGACVVVPLEEVVRGNLHALYPDAQVEHVSVFRVTRGGDLGVADDATGSLLEAVAEAARRRARNAVVRVEIERGMPGALRHAVLESLRRERAPSDPAFGERDLQEVDGLLDLGAVDHLPIPGGDGGGDLPRPPDYPPFRGARPVPASRPMLDVVGERDVLAHHPFDSFAATVVRFLREAADDAEVAAIRITLYRVGDPSPVVAALLDAARRGASVVAFVELQARFDESSNVRWARALEAAGGRVVYGLPGYKTHAKMALVVRREGGRLRSYAHVGTGNYNARSGRHYTDFSLFSADEALVGDVAELFNALTGSSRPPQRLTRGALVAPHQLLPALVERIAREGAHARAGREARITLKVNGLSDAEVIDALYRASGDGVTVQLIVRGICTLRPGVPGLSDRIRGLSVVGRFLEHSRVYRFANGGDPEYFVGSADLRPRNLRRRVELLAPVRDRAGRATLDRTLDLYLRDPTAWELSAAGGYERRGARGAGAQDVLVREARPAREEVPPPLIPPVGAPPMYSPAE